MAHQLARNTCNDNRFSEELQIAVALNTSAKLSLPEMYRFFFFFLIFISLIVNCLINLASGLNFQEFTRMKLIDRFNIQPSIKFQNTCAGTSDVSNHSKLEWWFSCLLVGDHVMIISMREYPYFDENLADEDIEWCFVLRTWINPNNSFPLTAKTQILCVLVIGAASVPSRWIRQHKSENHLLYTHSGRLLFGQVFFWFFGSFCRYYPTIELWSWQLDCPLLVSMMQPNKTFSKHTGYKSMSDFKAERLNQYDICIWDIRELNTRVEFLEFIRIDLRKSFFSLTRFQLLKYWNKVAAKYNISWAYNIINIYYINI